jgi:aspartate dehydrogenase
MAETMLQVGLIGGGGMGRDVISAVRASFSSEVTIVACLVRGAAACDGVPVVRSLPELLARGPKIVAELASHQAVGQYGADVLRSGVDLLVASTGALADMAVYEALRAAGAAGGARLLIPAGAVGGLDVLGALRLGGLSEVIYRSRKPPNAWMGTAAEKVVDLKAIVAATTFFSGTAREAALAFPQNANVAATIALAGIGFDNTRVELIADPDRRSNRHELEARGAIGRASVEIESKPSAGNPKTSAVTAFSIVRALANEALTVVV